MAKARNPWLEFTGRTHSEIESKYTRWLQGNVGKVRVIKTGEVKDRPISMRTPQSLRPLPEASDAYSMWVEYVILRPRRTKHSQRRLTN